MLLPIANMLHDSMRHQKIHRMLVIPILGADIELLHMRKPSILFAESRCVYMSSRPMPQILLIVAPVIFLDQLNLDSHYVSVRIYTPKTNNHMLIV